MKAVKFLIFFSKFISIVDAGYNILNFTCDVSSSDGFNYETCKTDSKSMNLTFNIKKPMNKVYVSEVQKTNLLTVELQNSFTVLDQLYQKRRHNLPTDF